MIVILFGRRHYGAHFVLHIAITSYRSWSNSNFKPQTSDELASMSFIDGLGKGQMISRQGLASPYLGDIQLSLCDRRGYLEVEIIRARNLQAKANKDTMPRKF